MSSNRDRKMSLPPGGNQWENVLRIVQQRIEARKLRLHASSQRAIVDIWKDKHSVPTRFMQLREELKEVEQRLAVEEALVKFQVDSLEAELSKRQFALLEEVEFAMSAGGHQTQLLENLYREFHGFPSEMPPANQD